MRYLTISLFLFFWGHLTLSSHSCYIGTKEYNNIVLEPKDSVLCRRSFSNGFEEICVVHTKKVCLINLKQPAAWEIREYALRQKNIFKQMEYNILKCIPAQILNKILEYKFNPILCKLIIAPHDGIVKKVSFQMSHKISSDFTNEDILVFENIILHTQFIPDSSINGDILLCNWVIGRKVIKEFLSSNR